MNVLLSVINADVYYSMEHTHACWELVYRLCGNSDTVIKSRIHRISEGDLYLIPPNTPHSDRAQDLFSDLVIRIDKLEFANFLILHDYDGFIYSVVKLINNVMNKKENNFKAVANSLAEALFQHLKPSSLSLESNHFVRKLKNIIFENIENTDFNLTKEIKNMNYNTDYIRRCFKAETNKTPLTYLTELRIDRAQQLLMMPTYESIETISAKCGFGDSFYFSTCFKKHTGLSPLQYRKKHSKELTT